MLQLADAPLLRMDELQWSRHYRCFPGQGAFDLESFLAAVARRRLRGPLSLEIFNDIFRQANHSVPPSTAAGPCCGWRKPAAARPMPPSR